MADIDYLSKEGLDRYDNNMKNYIGIELTKAEYDQLSEEEKIKGTYWITDYSSSGGSSNIELDKTFSFEGLASDAKAVGDAIIVRYNEETDHFEVLKDGEWEQTKIKVGLLKQILFSANNNEASFEASAYNAIGSQGVSPTLTIGETMNAYVSNSITYVYGTLVSELIDVTNYDKLVVYHKSTNSRNSGIEQNASIEWVKMYVTDSLSSKMTPLASIMLLNGIKTSEGEVTLDLSQVTGNVYIVFELATNAATMTTEISSLYLE